MLNTRIYTVVSAILAAPLSAWFALRIIGEVISFPKWALWTVAFFILITGLSEIANVVYNKSIDYFHNRKMAAISIKAQNLGSNLEDVKIASYKIYAYLEVSKKDSKSITTDDLFLNVELPESMVTVERAKAVELISLGGQLVWSRYKHNTKTDKWSYIYESNPIS